MKTFHDVYLGLYFVCWFTSLRDFFIWENVYVISIVSIAHAVHFSKQEVLRRQAARGSSGESEVYEMMGRKKNCKLNFFSMYFVQNNDEIHLSFKNSENSGHKLQSLSAEKSLNKMT